MEASQQESESSVQHIASYTDGLGHSWPPNTVNVPSASQDTHDASQTGGVSRSNSFISPLASPMSYKSTKRKRLAKACDACHRSKRRCDGTALCANCEFAGKACTYTDLSGRTVAPPRGRRIVGRRSTLEGGWPYPVADPASGDPDHVPLRVDTPVPTTSDTSPLDAALTQELVNLFFAHCHPATLIVHRPNFLYDLARSQVPAYLLLSVFAVAAPWSRRPSLRSNPSWHAGEVFAIQATNLLFFDDYHHVASLPDSVDSLRIKPCLEVAQALCLLQSHENVMRRQGRSNRILALVQDVLDVLDMAVVDTQLSGMAYASYVHNESLCRVFWFSYLSAVLTQYPLPTLGKRLEQLRLPVQEALFDMPRIENRLGSALSYDYLTLPPELKVCPSEFGNLVRVSCIYAGVVNAITQKEHGLHMWKQGQAPMPESTSFGSLEADLRKWLELLPDNFRLTEDNLQVHAQLDGGAGTAAWAFGYMHMLAEATVLALHQFANLGTERDSRRHSPREQKALDNLSMIMETMGQRARTNFAMARVLVAIGRHSAQQFPQVGSWFEEFHQMWGTTYEELMNIESHAAWATPMMERGEQSIPALPMTTLYKDPGRDPLLNLAKFGEDGLTAERFGALSRAAAVDGPTSNSSVPSSTQGPLRGFIGRRHADQSLPSIVTSGLPARIAEGQFYGDGMSLSDGRGGSEGSEYHSLGESPSAARVTTVASQLHAFEAEVHTILTSNSTRLIETSQYRSRTSTHSVRSYGNQATLEDGTDLSWLEDGRT